MKKYLLWSVVFIITLSSLVACGDLKVTKKNKNDNKATEDVKKDDKTETAKKQNEEFPKLDESLREKPEKLKYNVENPQQFLEAYQTKVDKIIKEEGKQKVENDVMTEDSNRLILSFKSKETDQVVKLSAQVEDAEGFLTAMATYYFENEQLFYYFNTGNMETVLFIDTHIALVFDKDKKVMELSYEELAKREKKIKGDLEKFLAKHK